MCLVYPFTLGQTCTFKNHSTRHNVPTESRITQWEEHACVWRMAIDAFYGSRASSNADLWKRRGQAWLGSPHTHSITITSSSLTHTHTHADSSYRQTKTMAGNKDKFSMCLCECHGHVIRQWNEVCVHRIGCACMDVWLFASQKCIAEWIFVWQLSTRIRVCIDSVCVGIVVTLSARPSKL